MKLTNKKLTEKEKMQNLREQYAKSSLLKNNVSSDPVKQFSKWFNEALKAGIPEPNAMSLATASEDGRPSVRIVLLKGFDERGFVFFTNYKSRKGKELNENPNACLVFFWKELERQIKLEGKIEKISSEESDAYFLSRPPGSQVGAWASPQSTVITGREVLDANVLKYTRQFEQNPLQRPQHWGGYRLKPQLVEFWQGRQSRLHDRLQYTIQENNTWKIGFLNNFLIYGGKSIRDKR